MPILEKLSSGIRMARRDAVANVDSREIFDGDVSTSARTIAGRSVALDGSARLCGAPGCANGWMKPWKNRRRPVFEEDWACGTKCMEAMVAAALRRELAGSGSAEAEIPHRHRVPLGLVLLAQGWITHPQLQTALEAQKATGRGRIGDWLTRSCGLPEERIARGLGVQWNCPVLTLDGFSPAAMALAMPKRFVAEFGMVPLRVAGGSILYVAFQERMDEAAALSLEHMCGLKVENGLLPSSMLESARQRLLNAESVPVKIRLVADADALTAAMVKVIEQKQPVASRLVRIRQYFWMRLWKEEGSVSPLGTLPSRTEDMEDHIFLMS